MDRNDYRDGDDTDQPDAYWRRRAITLAVGLGLIGLLAWAFTGGGGKPPAPAAAKSPSGLSSAAAYSSEQAQEPQSATATASAGTKSGETGKAGTGDATVPGLPSPSADASPTPSKGAKLPTAGSTAKASADPTGDGVEADGSCAPSAIVLTLVGGQTSYERGQDPSFGVDVVSTASRTCSADLGAKQLDMIVMSSGRIIWDSSDCAKDDSSQSTELSRGVPVQETMTWNRTITLPGCVTLADSARAGTYEVQARDGSVGSPLRTIKLVR